MNSPTTPARPPRLAFALAALLALSVGLPGAARGDAPGDPTRPRSVTHTASGESSIGFLFGVGWYDNSDFNADLVRNGIPPIENGFEYGLQFRRRVSRWFSLGRGLRVIEKR